MVAHNGCLQWLPTMVAYIISNNTWNWERAKDCANSTTFTRTVLREVQGKTLDVKVILAAILAEPAAVGGAPS